MRAPCVIICLIGLYLSVLLLQLHTRDSAVPDFATKICERVGGCHQVLQSKWANFPPVEKLPADSAVVETGSVIQEYAVPVALLGICYFSGLLVWFFFIGRSTLSANIIVIVVCLLGCLASAWYLYLMDRVIDASCPFCLIVHSANFLLLLATLNYFLRSGDETVITRAQYGATAAAILTLWTAIGFGWRSGSLAEDNEVLSEALSAIQNDIETVEMVWRTEAPVEIGIRENLGEHSRAEFDPMVNALPGFRNTVVVFGNAESEACHDFYRLLFGQLRPYYGGHLRIVWKHLPESDANPNALTAARALEAARLQGKFWVLLEALYENRDRLDRLDYLALASDCGMNPETFNRDVKSPATRTRIEADIREAGRLGLEKTPAVFLNNRRVDDSIRNLPGFWKLQASRLRTTRLRNRQGWGTATGGLAGGGEPGGTGPNRQPQQR